MDEWLRTLTSAGVGFFAGLVMEPMKATLARRFKRREVRGDLDFEMANICSLLWSWLVSGEDVDLLAFVTDFDFGKYEFYTQKDGASFNLVTNYWAIKRFYADAHRIFRPEFVPRQQRQSEAAEFLLRLSYPVALNPILFKRLLGPATCHFMRRHVRQEFLERLLPETVVKTIQHGYPIG